MPYGFWSKAGLRWRWPRRWDGMPIPLAGGLPSSVRTVRRRWPSSSRGVPPRDRRSAADRTEGSAAGGSSKGWPRLGQLELEGGAQICAGTLRGLPKPQQLPELPAPLGICAETAQEASAQSRRSQAGDLRGGVCRPGGRGAAGGAKVFFVDEAHFRADADLRGKWVLKGEPALVDSTSPRWGEKASYYSAVCLETGEVEWMELEGNSNCCNLRHFPAATEGAARGTIDGDLG